MYTIGVIAISGTTKFLVVHGTCQGGQLGTGYNICGVLSSCDLCNLLFSERMIHPILLRVYRYFPERALVSQLLDMI